MKNTFNFSFKTWQWLGFILLASAYVLVFFHRMAAGVVSEDLIASFQIDAVALGVLASSYYYIYTALQIPSGVISDTLGPRWSVGCSGLLAAVGTLIFALAGDIVTATIGRLIVGMSLAFVFVGLMKYNTVWFPPRLYGTVSGLTLFIGNLGAIAATMPLAWVITVPGVTWRSVFIALAVIGAILSVLTLIFLRDHPSHIGPTAAPVKPSRHWLRELTATMKNRKLWPAFWVQFGTTGAVFAFAGLWLPRLMRDVHEVSKHDASLYAMAIMLGLAIGSLSNGIFSDRAGRRKPFIVGYAALAFIIWAILLTDFWSPGFTAYALFFLLGFAGGGIAIVYALARESSNPRFSGMAIAVVNMGLFLGAATAQPFFGRVMSTTWDGTVVNNISIYDTQDYQWGLMLSLAFAGIGLIAAFMCTETYCKNAADIAHENIANE